MAGLVMILMAGMLALVALMFLAARGFRDGDCPGDVVVTAELGQAGQPDETRPVVVAKIRNPSGSPVLVGLVARPAQISAWAQVSSITVPVRTTRQSLRPDNYETLGVVQPKETVRFAVPVAVVGRCYWLTAAVGQAGGRLRVHHLPVTYAGSRPTGPTPYGFLR